MTSIIAPKKTTPSATQTTCRICDHLSQPFLSLGSMPIANGFLQESEFSSEYFFDLAVSFCPTCFMVQLIEQPDPERMFHSQYPFFTASSERMKRHFKQFSHDVIHRYGLDSQSKVLEVGSNDGTFLQQFAVKEMAHLGVEPSGNVATIASKNGVRTINRFFNKETAKDIKQEFGEFDVCLAANVLCHIPDLHSVISGLGLVLKKQGVFIFEDPYLGDILSKTAYDQIYDEHVFYFSLHSVKAVFEPSGFEVIHVEPQSTHGGSMRYSIARKGERSIDASVDQLLLQEKERGFDSIPVYEAFAKACEESRSKLVSLMRGLRAKGKTIVGYAATSKSTTVFNYCQLGPAEIAYIADTTPMKQNKFSPGAHIPVRAYDAFQENYPDYALLLGWNHREEILKKEKKFSKQGGKWISYVPNVEILEEL